MKKFLSLILFLTLVFIGCSKQYVDDTVAVKEDTTVAEKCIVRIIGDIEVEIAGTYEQFVGKKARYDIVVSNTGGKTLNDIDVVYNIPEDVNIVDAGGADFNDAKLRWHIEALGYKESRSFEFIAGMKIPGKSRNIVIVTTKDEDKVLEKQDEFTTIWKEQPALLINMIDATDPLMVEEITSYEIVVSNLEDSSDGNIRLEVYFPKELEPFETWGDGESKISGRVAVFKFSEDLSTGSSCECFVRAKAASTGEGVVKAKFTSTLKRSPVVVEEEVHVF